jgi:putative aminopeptidase FrvX
MTTLNLPTEFALLEELLLVDSPTGDEYRMSGVLAHLIHRQAPSAHGVQLGSSIVVSRGKAVHTAIMAHIDTTGFTLGYNQRLIGIGTPAPVPNDRLRALDGDDGPYGIEFDAEGWKLKDSGALAPGSRLVYANKPTCDGTTLTAPYLDNRAGVWAALQVLFTCPDCIVAFTTGEEISGLGARACAKYLYEQCAVKQVLIADITWDTTSVHCGLGPAISLRDASVPNRQFIDRLLAIAAESRIPYQLEIESDGGSDGGHIEAGSCPIDWAFVGAPETGPHASHEGICLSDLSNMAKLLKNLVGRLAVEQ